MSSGYPIPPGYVPPTRPPASHGSAEYFPPPPRQEFNEDHWPEDQARGAHDGGYDNRAPRSEYSQAHEPYNPERPYAPSDPYGHEDNQMAPYEEEKAEAEQRRVWEEDQMRRRQNAQNYPPTGNSRDPRGRYDDDYDDRSYDDRDRRDRGYRYNDRDRDRYTYSDDLSSYDSRDRRYDERDRDRDRDLRRKDSRGSPTKTGKDFFGGKEGQRGLSAQILGGAAGGLAGHELGGSLLETLGGVVVGAMGAKVLENQYEKKKAKDGAMRNAAPFKDDAVRDRRRSDRSDQRDRPPPPRDDRRDDRRDYPRKRSRSRTRSRGAPRRRGSESDYSDDYSPPPSRR